MIRFYLVDEFPKVSFQTPQTNTNLSSLMREQRPDFEKEL